MHPAAPTSTDENSEPVESSVTRLTRDRIISVVLLIVTVISFVVAWPARDHELAYRLSMVSEEQPVSLYQEKLFCITLTDCFRAMHKLIITAARIPIEGLTSVLYALPGSTVTEVPTFVPQYARNLGPYLVFRALVIAAIAFALYRYFRRWWAVALVANILLWWSTGVPIRAIVRLYGNLVSLAGDPTVGSPLQYHFSMNSTIFLLEYDYLALSLLLFFPIWLRDSRIHQGILKPLVLGVLLAMSFEHLAIVYVVALVWLSWRNKLKGWVRPATLITLGWGVYIAAMIIHARLSLPGSESRIVSITQLGYRINREGDHEWIIVRFVFGFLLVPYLLGRVVGVITRSLGLLRAASENLRPYIHAVVLGLCLSYLVGFFHSALITEFGRQTIAAQALLLISGLLKHSSATRSDAVTASSPRLDQQSQHL
jgi:hypothetical protein